MCIRDSYSVLSKSFIYSHFNVFCFTQCSRIDARREAGIFTEKIDTMIAYACGHSLECPWHFTPLCGDRSFISRNRTSRKCDFLHDFQIVGIKKRDITFQLCLFVWYLQESNQGHMDFQSIALPTELRYRAAPNVSRALPFSRKDCKFIFFLG